MMRGARAQAIINLKQGWRTMGERRHNVNAKPTSQGYSELTVVAI
jgi:hypothetical protein